MLKAPAKDSPALAVPPMTVISLFEKVLLIITPSKALTLLLPLTDIVFPEIVRLMALFSKAIPLPELPSTVIVLLIMLRFVGANVRNVLVNIPLGAVVPLTTIVLFITLEFSEAEKLMPVGWVPPEVPSMI